MEHHAKGKLPLVTRSSMALAVCQRDMAIILTSPEALIWGLLLFAQDT